MSELAPVLVAVYDRPDHLKRCLAALAACDGARDTTVHIVSDKEKDTSRAAAVAAVRDVIREARGFREVVPILRERNLGFPDSIDTARDLILEEHGRLIALEDDVLASRGFLRYMNEALEVYADNPKIHRVCAWSWAATPEDPRRHYFLRAFSAWGTGMWRHKWVNADSFRKTAEEFRNSWALLRKTNDIMPHALDFLHRIAVQGRFVGDVSIALECIKHDLYCVFPARSLVENIGHDGSGLHCTHAGWVDSQETWQNPWPGLDQIPIEELECHREASVRFYGGKSLRELVRLYAPLAPLLNFWVKRTRLKRVANVGPNE
jgi:hypothetical protein